MQLPETIQNVVQIFISNVLFIMRNWKCWSSFFFSSIFHYTGSTLKYAILSVFLIHLSSSLSPSYIYNHHHWHGHVQTAWIRMKETFQACKANIIMEKLNIGLHICAIFHSECRKRNNSDDSKFSLLFFLFFFTFSYSLSLSLSSLRITSPFRMLLLNFHEKDICINIFNI